MSASEIEVYNLSLSNISSQSFVESLDEDTIERITCTVHFQSSLDEVLEDHDWGFASKFKTLALIRSVGDDPAPPLPWQFEYQYPADCIVVREIAKDADSEPEIPWQPGLNDAGNGEVIYTDKPQARARFTMRVTNPIILSPKAVVALSWKLSTRIVKALVGDTEEKQNAENEYRNAIANAGVSNFNERVNREAREPSGISSRI